MTASLYDELRGDLSVANLRRVAAYKELSLAQARCAEMAAVLNKIQQDGWTYTEGSQMWADITVVLKNNPGQHLLDRLAALELVLARATEYVANPFHFPAERSLREALGAMTKMGGSQDANC